MSPRSLGSRLEWLAIKDGELKISLVIQIKCSWRQSKPFNARLNQVEPLSWKNNHSNLDHLRFQGELEMLKTTPKNAKKTCLRLIIQTTILGVYSIIHSFFRFVSNRPTATTTSVAFCSSSPLWRISRSLAGQKRAYGIREFLGFFRHMFAGVFSFEKKSMDWFSGWCSILTLLFICFSLKRGKWSSTAHLLIPKPSPVDFSLGGVENLLLSKISNKLQRWHPTAGTFFFRGWGHWPFYVSSLDCLSWRV